MIDPRDPKLKGLSSQVFMLRFWSEDLGDGHVDWRGKIQHINSGEVTYFRDWSILERFIQGLLYRFPNDDIYEDQKNDLEDKGTINQ